MKLKELEDLSWFPDTIRKGMTDYLRFIFHTGDMYRPAIPLITQGVLQTKATRIIDLCSGGGGTIVSICHRVGLEVGRNIPVVLTDRFPNNASYKLLSENSKGAVLFSSGMVDAQKVPPELDGFRTIFSGIHHFSQHETEQVLSDSIKQKQGIGIFDGGDRHVLFAMLIFVLHPLLFFFCTPFIGPFRFSRLFFTYIIPLIPLCAIYDGILSVLRLYEPEELLEIAIRADKNNEYIWASGKLRNQLGLRITYLTGVPKV